ncbi:hypothetical protein [Qipengyuania huizhouensis]|uniref:hypothetical protein n=1 Tax=Qipengyuania huizhouensis TaxID=2867245 RepID=UPI001C874467|nr:hypothetical protein [Qipengyuania huizhouensis]MBX7460810.1 hypothetical protein [Qipengyuania huizhouensis]
MKTLTLTHPEIATREPRYEAGWFQNIENDEPAGYVAFLRPYSEDWYDLYRRATWWEAMAAALEIADRMPDCKYVGGPE